MNRIKWLDVCKGLGMLLVIIGHVMTTPVREAWSVGAYTYTIIYFFHMPLMFYISGFAYKTAAARYESMSGTKFTLKKFKSLIVPYVLYNIAVFVIFALANLIGGISAILTPAGYGRIGIGTFIIDMLKGDNPYSFHMWFIYAMFIMTMVLWGIEKICRKLFDDRKGENIARIILIIIAFILVATRFYVNTATFGVINETMEFFIWFVLGRYLDTEKIMSKKYITAYSLISVIYMLISVFKPDILGRFSFYIIWPYVALFAKMGLILLFIKLAMIITDSFKENKIYTFFSLTGFNSLYIYMFHQPFFGSGTGLVIMKFIGVPVISVVISMIMCYVAPVIIIKLKDAVKKQTA